MLFRRTPSGAKVTATARYHYTNARRQLVFMLIFTLVNVVLALLKGKFYMLFSASVPYCAASYTRLFFDMTGSPAVLAVGGLVIAVIMLAYFACWQFSKNKWGWLLAATVLFGADCLFLLGFSLLSGGLVQGLLDLLFHAWVMYYLVRGCANRTGIHTFEPPEQAQRTDEEENGPPKAE